MKKIIAIAATVVLAFALSGCVTQVTKESKEAPSASDKSASAAASASASSASSAAVNWTSALTPDEAAKGAGISSFGVPQRTVIADFVFTGPAFAYTEHVAQATYEVPSSAKLIVRKAEGAHTAPITDRDKSQFSQTWQNTYEGYDVTCYGNKQGAATICVWNDGTKEYGVTIEGFGSAEVTMDAEDVDDIVKAVKAAESEPLSAAQPAASGSAASGSAASSATGTPGFNVEKFVGNNNLGQFVRYYYVQGENGKGYWAIVTRGADGGEYTTYADTSGNVVQGGVEVGSVPDAGYDGADFNVEGLVQKNGLGQFKRYYWIQGENGKGYWGIVTTDANGNEKTTYTDELGNIIQDGSVEVGSMPDAGSAANNGADFSVEGVVQQNNLGQFEHYYWIQGSGNNGYWAIVTRGADGAEHTTYTDEQGNVIQGGAPQQ